MSKQRNPLARLHAGGWEIGNTENFLQLSDEEAQLVALKLSQMRGSRQAFDQALAKVPAVQPEEFDRLD